MSDVRISAIQGSQWSDDVKASAYEVYAHRCNGDMICTLDTLAERDGPKIPEKTVYDWRKRYGWDAKLQAEREAIAPYSWNLYFGGLSVAAPEVVRYLRSVVADKTKSDRDRIAASGKLLNQIAVHIEQIEQRMTGGTEAAALSDADLLALETPWVPEEQGSETPD